MQRLSEREEVILNTLIGSYVATGEPVGSRTISKSGLGLSSATVRKSMADLEEEGSLSHPHISAGRVPTDRGYRYYVDLLMSQDELVENERRRIRDSMAARVREGNIESLLEQVSRVIADISKNLGVALTPSFERGIFQHLEMVHLSESKLLLVLTIKSGLVKTMVMEVDARVDADDLEATRRLINERLSGLTIGDILTNVSERLEISSEGSPKLLRLICDSADSLFEFSSEEDLHLVGTGNFFLQPEFSENRDQLARLYQLFEERSQMTAILNDRMGEGIAITIGGENESPELSGCSLLTSKYRMGNVTGVIGLMGPTRLAYAKMVPLISYMASLTENLLEEKFEGIDKRKWFCPWCGVAQYYDKSDFMGRTLQTKNDK